MSQKPGTVVRAAVLDWLRQSFAVASLLDWTRPKLRRGGVGQSAGLSIADHEFAYAGLPLRTRASGYRDRALLRRITNPSTRWPYPRVVAGPDPMALRPPMVLATFHVGAIPALGALLERLPAEVLALTGGPAQVRGSVRTIGVSGGELQRSLALKTAVETLRSGRFVFLVIGEHGTAQFDATLFGRRVSLARGTLALSRIANSPILPLTAHWRGSRIEIVAGDPIAPGDEATMAAGLMKWLERYLREHPEELRPPLAKLLRG